MARKTAVSDGPQQTQQTQQTQQAQQVRREAGPTTDRGAVRKQQLLEAARRVFEDKGFIETRIVDIVRAAGVSHGTFYTYFETKEDVFTAVGHDVIESMLVAMTVSIPTSGFGDRVHDSVMRFVTAYRPHAKMIGLMEQVGTYSPDMRALRLEVRDTFVQRTSRGIARMKSDGLTDPDLDVEYTAEVLGAMLEYTCYVWFCLDKSFDEQRLVDTLSTIWIRTLQAT